MQQVSVRVAVYSSVARLFEHYEALRPHIIEILVDQLSSHTTLGKRDGSPLCFDKCVSVSEGKLVVAEDLGTLVRSLSRCSLLCENDSSSWTMYSNHQDPGEEVQMVLESAMSLVKTIVERISRCSVDDFELSSVPASFSMPAFSSSSSSSKRKPVEDFDGPIEHEKELHKLEVKRLNLSQLKNVVEAAMEYAISSKQFRGDESSATVSSVALSMFSRLLDLRGEIVDCLGSDDLKLDAADGKGEAGKGKRGRKKSTAPASSSFIDAMQEPFFGKDALISMFMVLIDSASAETVNHVVQEKVHASKQIQQFVFEEAHRLVEDLGASLYLSGVAELVTDRVCNELAVFCALFYQEAFRQLNLYLKKHKQGDEGLILQCLKGCVCASQYLFGDLSPLRFKRRTLAQRSVIDEVFPDTIARLAQKGNMDSLTTMQTIAIGMKRIEKYLGNCIAREMFTAGTLLVELLGMHARSMVHRESLDDPDVPSLLPKHAAAMEAVCVSFYFIFSVTFFYLVSFFCTSSLWSLFDSTLHMCV